MKIPFGEGAAHEEVVREELALVAVTRQDQLRAAVFGLRDAHGVVVQDDDRLGGVREGEQLLQRHASFSVRNDAGAPDEIEAVQNDTAVIERRNAGFPVKRSQRRVVRFGIVVAQHRPLAVFRRKRAQDRRHLVFVAALVHVAVVELVAGERDQVRVQRFRFPADAAGQALAHDRSDVQVGELNDAVGLRCAGFVLPQIHLIAHDLRMRRVQHAARDDTDGKQRPDQDHPGAEMGRQHVPVQRRVHDVAQHDHGRAVH